MLLMIYTTCPDLKSAKLLMDTLIKDRLVACANISSSKSAYIWLDEIQKTNEYIVLMKSRVDLQDLIVAKIKSIHPYDVPAILYWQAGCDSSYLSWIESVTQV